MLLKIIAALCEFSKKIWKTAQKQAFREKNDGIFLKDSPLVKNMLSKLLNIVSKTLDSG